jgi:hypothetical protein
VKSPLSVIIAIGVGLLILLGYFFNTPILSIIQTELISWAITLTAVSILVGVISLLTVHLRKIQNKDKGITNSLILILSFITTLALGIYFGPMATIFQSIWSAIQIPVETSLLSLLAISLAYAIFRVFHRKINLFSVIFVITVLLMLLINSGFLPINNIPVIKDIAYILNQIPVAGARGILLGVALGSLTTGLRVLLGSDRPYRG